MDTFEDWKKTVVKMNGMYTDQQNAKLVSENGPHALILLHILHKYR